MHFSAAVIVGSMKPYIVIVLETLFEHALSLAKFMSNLELTCNSL